MELESKVIPGSGVLGDKSNGLVINQMVRAKVCTMQTEVYEAHFENFDSKIPNAIPVKERVNVI